MLSIFIFPDVEYLLKIGMDIEKLKDFVSVLENCLGIKAKIDYRGMQQGDVKTTHADTQALEDYIGYSPKISIEDGVKNFVEWYLKYYRL